MKVCPDCGETKPLDEFYVDRRAKTGRTTYCKPCTAARNKRSYAKRDPEVKRAAWRRQYAADPEGAKQRTRGWVARNREQHLARRKAFREANRERLAAAWARYYEEHSEELSARKQAKYDPDRKRLSRTPEQADRARAKRRANKANVPHEPWTRQEIFERDGGHCLECGTDCSTVPWEIDHIVPLNPGPDLKWNLQLLCRDCNRRKARRPGEPKPPPAALAA